MQSREARALGQLAGQASAGLASRVEELHVGIAQRVFASLGAGGAPVRAAHERIAKTAYAAVRGGLGVAGRAGGVAAGLALAPDAPALERTTAGRVAIGALNGVFGDRLSEPLASGMAVARPISDPTGRVAVFLHGLCETEAAWWLGAQRHQPYGERLRAELGYTPVYVRYNSGDAIADNGRALAKLLDRLTDEWPVEVEEITLVGHSMGGLLARYACHEGGGRPWVASVRHVFLLGAPHRGAPLEKAASAASAALALLPETRPLATGLNLRSVGIKDLGRDCEVPYLRSANYYFVAATVAGDPGSPAGRLIGDLLVLPASAWGQSRRARRLEFPLDNYRQLGGAHHFDLLNHPAIYELIRTWLARPALCQAPQSSD
jgi:pimeloyl-ACP methyl ester carboxylesterase